jgi:hypothetical protein
MAQDKTLDEGKGFSMDLNDKREAVFQALFDEAKKEIDRLYLPEVIAHIREHEKALYEEILATEMRLNDLWLSMKQGKNTPEQFGESLRIWKNLHLNGIQLCRGQGDQKGGEQGDLF